MEQMADEMTLRADVTDKGRVRGERLESDRRPSRNTDPRECEGSSPPLVSLKMHLRRSSSRSSSTPDSLSSSQHSNQGVDCAGVLLDCLFCRFYDMILAARCCPDYEQVVTTTESSPGEDDDCDCGLFPCCQDAGDCLELAMEASELCYH